MSNLGQSHSKTFDVIQTTQNKALRIIEEIIRKIHFSSELLFNRAKFIKLVKSTFHDR